MSWIVSLHALHRQKNGESLFFLFFLSPDIIEKKIPYSMINLVLWTQYAKFFAIFFLPNTKKQNVGQIQTNKSICQIEIMLLYNDNNYIVFKEKESTLYLIIHYTLKNKLNKIYRRIVVAP
jgi:hypothetical protein